MKLPQIALIVVLGTACVATYATSETLQTPRAFAEQDIRPAPQASLSLARE